MPIVSRNLDFARPQTDGTLRCRVSAVDSKGRNWMHGPFSTSNLAEAEAIRDSVFTSTDLEQKELQEVIQWVIDGNNHATYPREEFATLDDLRSALIKYAVRAGFLENPEFHCALAPQITVFNVTQIENALGISTAKAQKILNRAIRLEDTICPSLVLDAADVQEDI